MAKTHDELIALANLQWTKSLEPPATERAATAASAAETVAPEAVEQRVAHRERRVGVGVVLGL